MIGWREAGELRNFFGWILRGERSEFGETVGIGIDISAIFEAITQNDVRPSRAQEQDLSRGLRGSAYRLRSQCGF